MIQGVTLIFPASISWMIRWCSFPVALRLLRSVNSRAWKMSYTQEIPSSVKATVEALDLKLFGILNTIEHEFKM